MSFSSKGSGNKISFQVSRGSHGNSRDSVRESPGTNCRPVRKFPKSDRLSMEEYRKITDEADFKCPKKYKKRPKEERTYHFLLPQEVVEEEEECEPLPSVCGPLPCSAPPIASFKEQIDWIVQCVHQRMKDDKHVTRRKCPPEAIKASKSKKCCKELPRPQGSPGCCKCCKCEDPPSYSIAVPKSCGGFMDDEDEIVISDLQDQCCPPLEIIQPTFNDFMGIMDMSYEKMRMGKCGTFTMVDDDDDDIDDDETCPTKNPCNAMVEVKEDLKERNSNGGKEPCERKPEIPKEEEEFFGCEDDNTEKEKSRNSSLCN